MIPLFKKNPVIFGWTISLGGTLAIIIGLYLVNISWGIENFSKTVSLPLYTVIPGILVILSIWSISKPKAIVNLPRKSLLFLTLAFCCWYIAEQTWNLYEHVLGIDPYPSIADFFYLSAPVFMFAALLIFLKSYKRKITNKKIFVSCIISSIVLIPSIFFVFEANTDSNLEEIIIGFSYPVVDSILLVSVIMAILIAVSDRENFFWIMILLGIVAFIIADSVFLYLVINDEYVDGHPIDILWISGYTIWTFMMFYSIIQSSQQNKKKILEVFKKEDKKHLESYGVLFVLIVINAVIAILLLEINNFANSSEDVVLTYFSLILIVTVVIFSSLVVILNSRLNKLLQNKTRQLEEATQELIKSERFKAIGELASRVSHDIRNPLSNIQMSIELMRNSAPDTKLNNALIQQKLDLVSKNIERISHQVNDVLGFVKNREVKKIKFRLATCLKDSLELIKIPKTISIKTSNLEKFIFADPFQIQIVFNNLLMNAVQAIGKDKGEIFVEAIENENEWVLEISNSGPEIPEDILPHIFDSLVTTKLVGTGLGLVSCKTIVENHGGTIAVRNNPTTFTIILPKITRI